MKLKNLIIATAIVITSLNINAIAQRRATSNDDNFQKQADKKALTVQKNKTSKSIYNESKESNNKIPFTSKSNTQLSSNQASYDKLINKQLLIQTEIETLAAQINNTKGSKAKKIAKQLDALQKEKKVINAQLSMYPRSIYDAQYAQQLQQQENQRFKQLLDAQAAELIAQNDPYAGKISEDPQLQKAYKEYLESFTPQYIPEQNQSSQPEMQYSQNQVVYRIMFAITNKPLSTQTINQLQPVIQQKLPSGGTVYYSGNFSSRAEAQTQCNKILAQGLFRDAFVVAMIGDKRVPLQ